MSQLQLGVVIPEGISWASNEGPSSEMYMDEDGLGGFEEEMFTHIITLGATGWGKGVFCSTFGLWLRDNFKYKFIDFNDNGVYENCYYGWPQDDETMLARLEDTFPLNEPMGYPFEVYFAEGTMEKYPDFFTPFTLGWKDFVPMDFDRFYKRGSAEEDMSLRESLEEATDIEDFIVRVTKCQKAAYPVLEYLYTEGILADETTLDFDALADWETVHSFGFSSVPDGYVRAFLTDVVVRMIHDSRANKKLGECSFYIREAGTSEKSIVRDLATRGRHVGVHFIADSQRRVSMMDKTAGFQFSSQAVFHMPYEQAKETFFSFGINSGEALKQIAHARRGVALLNFAGSDTRLWPVAVSPPVCSYRTTRVDYADVCDAHNVRWISNNN